MLVAVAAGLSACNVKGGRTDYSKSPDSGAVAPAIKMDTSLTRTYPESTAGGPQRTGKPGVAGDTLSTGGQPVGTRGRASVTSNRAKPKP
jgi:hypothetical protein